MARRAVVEFVAQLLIGLDAMFLRHMPDSKPTYRFRTIRDVEVIVTLQTKDGPLNYSFTTPLRDIECSHLVPEVLAHGAVTKAEAELKAKLDGVAR